MSDMTAGTTTDVEVVVVEEPRRDFVGSIGMAARENPVSAALIAMGAVWLFAGGSKVSILGSRLGRQPVSPRYSMDDPAPSVVGLHAEGAAVATRDAARDARRAAQDAGRQAGDLAGRTSAAAGDAVDAMAEAAESVAQGVSSTMRRTGSALSEAGTTTSRAVRRTANSTWNDVEDIGQSVRDLLEDQPLAIAALGLAAGAGLALALPRTQAERDLMGERSEALRERAQTLAARGIDDAREGGDAALARAVRDARAQGLTEGAVQAAVEKFTAKLGKVALAARDAAKDEVDRAAERK